MLRDNQLLQHMPTQKPTMEELRVGNLVFQTFDLGGHAIAQRLWREYSADADALVYLIDSSDRSRFAESKKALADLWTSDETSSVPLLILGNKIDAPGAASEDELRLALGIAEADRSGPWAVFMCSVTQRQGYKEGFQWLARTLQGD